MKTLIGRGARASSCVMWTWLIVGCRTADPDVARLEAELVELRARVEALEARPGLDVDALMERANQLIGEIGAAGDAGELDVRASEGISKDLFEDLGEASKLGRLLLHRGPDGEFDGFRVSAIRAGSPLDRAGIRNGDVIHTVNGHGLGSMAEALAAYEAVKGEDPEALQVRITRRGEELTLAIPVLRSGEGGAEEAELDASLDAERARRRDELQERLRQRRAEREAAWAEPTP